MEVLHALERINWGAKNEILHTLKSVNWGTKN
jgi:hypothetical protein